MAISTVPLCLLLLGALCLANAATATVQRDLVDAAKFLYDSLSQAQVQQKQLNIPPIICYINLDGLIIC